MADAQPAEALPKATVTDAFQTHKPTPYWVSFTVPPIDDEFSTVEFQDRHITQLSCWNRQTHARLGSAIEDQSTGEVYRANAGVVVSLGSSRQALTLDCRIQFAGPAHLRIQTWTRRGFGSAVRHFHRDSGILDGGLGILAVFMLVTAIVNRRALYVIFAAWLIINLRMAAISTGWDVYWFGATVPWDWLIPMRMWTAAAYYVLITALFGGLFAEDLKKVGWQWLWRINQFSCFLVILACATLSFTRWLPVLWSLSVFTLTVIFLFLIRILLITRSRVAVWYGLSLAVTLFATFNEVLAAALNLRGLIGHVNSVSAAVFGSLIAALALAEQMRQEHEQRVRAQRELHTAYDASPIGLFTLDKDGKFLRANPSMNAVLGVHHAVGTFWRDHFNEGGWTKLLAHVGGDNHDLELSKMSGEAMQWTQVRASRSDDSIEGSLQDITERTAVAEHMRFLANHDPLTGVLNRRGIEHILDNVKRSGHEELSLAYLDLDRFKLLNDLYGHVTGDHILRQVCDRISALLQHDEFLGRVGGDEFVILFSNTPHDDAGQRCRDIVASISEAPYPMGDRAAQVRASIGLLNITDDILLQDAISLADRACREAKNGHHEGLVIYRSGSAALHERADELRMMQLFNANAVPDGLFLLMQPILSLSAPHESLDFEVLLRMREADGTVTSAFPVVTAAERSGRIAVVDRWVLSNVLGWIKTNHERLVRTHFICVNLSGGSLNDENFVRDVYTLLADAGDAAKLLCLEITESVALQDLTVTRRFIDQTRQYGVKIALDDFGAGYTSFSYLRELPTDAVKIDGAFIKGMMGHPANLAIVTAIIDLAHNLGMKTIAEWVEDIETLEGLIEAGADYVQGYLLGRPCDPSKILACESAADLIEDERTAKYVSTFLRLAQERGAIGSNAPKIPKLH